MENVLGQVLDQFCASASSPQTGAASASVNSSPSSDHQPAPVDTDTINSNSSLNNYTNNLNSTTSQGSQDLASKPESLQTNLASPIKRSILYEHLLKDISPTSKNSSDVSLSIDNHSKLKWSANSSNEIEYTKCKKLNSPNIVNDGNIIIDDRIKSKIMNLSTKCAIDEDASVPLNLCVKKAAASTSSNQNETIYSSNNSKSSNLVNNLVLSNRQQAPNNTSINRQQSSLHSSASVSQQQKKRGRKPKALLNNNDQFANFAEISSIANNYLAQAEQASQSSQLNNVNFDAKPRKRGRPPTLSPPHNVIQPLAAHGSNLAKAANTASAFNVQFPFNNNLFNTQDVLNWPGLNALTAAAAAAAAASSSGSPFGNIQNPFNILNKLNSKDLNNFNFNNLLNSNLFNLKNQLAASQDNSSPTNKSRNEKKSREESNSNLPSKNQMDALPSKGSLAHKPHANEKQLRIPLNHGWKRLTYITGFSKLGAIEGEVNYLAPCGKKIKSYPELIKYLTKNGIASMTRDHFSFDPNILVGQFIENIQELGSEVILSESQVKVQLEEISKFRNFCQPSSSNQTVQNNHILPEKKRRVRDSGGTRNVYDSIKNYKSSFTNKHESSQLRKNDVEPSITITLQNQNTLKGTKRKSIEQNRYEYLKNEKLAKRQEEERKLRELKEKQEEEQKLKEAQERQLEQQKQEELKILEEIDRERANQHQMFIHALTELKSCEDNQTKKEDTTLEKNAIYERRLIKKALENELLRELKKPVEDMLLTDHKSIPIFNRIPGLKLTGKAFSDALMVFEFLYNFGETIGFDIDSLPTLNTLMMALLNLDKEAEEELMSILIHLIVCAIEDPGLPTNVTTAMGQKLKDATVTIHNVTQVLCLYFHSFDDVVADESKHNRIECKIYNQLCNGIPFLSMNATCKLDILVFLCNELLSNQAIVKQIEDNIETVSSLKKDKWVLENDIRKFRVVKMKRERITELENAKQKELENAKQKELEILKQKELEIPKPKESPENCDDIVDSDIEETSNTITAPPTPSITQEFDDDINLTNEEIDKKIDRLNKQCNQMNNKLNKASNSYRVFPLGQDRYRRTYWLLPHSGGVFLEGIESGDPDELANNLFKEDEVELVNNLKEETNAEEDETEKKVNIENNTHVTEDEDVKIKDDKEDSVSQNSTINSDEVSIKSGTDDNSDDKNLKEDNSSQDLSQEGDESKDCKPSEETKVDVPIVEDNANNSDVKKSETTDNEQDTNTQATNSAEINAAIENLKWFDLLLSNNCETEECTDVVKVEVDVDKIGEIEDKSLQLEKSLATFLDQETIKCLFSNTEENLDAAILKDLFLRIVSAFPKSALITQFPNSDINEGEVSVCSNLQKRIQLWKSVQYDAPLKIPREFQLGWWRITDPSQLKSMVELLHTNALRERNLQKHLIKHLNQAMQSCKSSVANLEVNDYDREASEAREFGAPMENKCPHKLCHSKGYCIEVALSKDLQVLEQIEAFEEKILSSSMQVRNWKPSNKVSSTDFKSKPNSTSKVNKTKANKKKQKSSETPKDAENDEHAENGTAFELNNGNIEENGDTDLLKIQREKLLEIEVVIERRYLKPPLGYKNNAMLLSAQSNSDYGNSEDYNEYAADENATTGLIRWRDAVRDAKCSAQIAMCLHFLENCIAWDKSIMRASCQFCSSGENEAQLLLCDLCDKGYHMYCFKPKMETVPNGDWFCFDCQNKNTIDKVCIVCGKKGKLLNCDTCAKVFHPNCLDPPVTKQLKGRWLCHMCANKNKRYSGQKSSVKKSTKEVNSVNSSEAKNNDTANNNQQATAANNNNKESKRVTNGNAKEKVEKEPKKERKSKKEKDKEKDDKEKDNKKDTKEKKEKDKEKNKKDKEKEKESVTPPTPVIVEEPQNEIDLCKKILEEMEKHENGWPFLLPVNTKQFPTYKKIIKKPMDMATIKAKFESNSYKTKEDFADDIRLIFDNCVTFNEDESPVGQAGHSLRAFFETNWNQTFSV